MIKHSVLNITARKVLRGQCDCACETSSIISIARSGNHEKVKISFE